MTLWSAAEAAAATGGRAIGDWQAGGVSIATRTLQKGDLFVALKAVRDGHEFVAQALAGGAAAALVSHVPEGVGADAPLLIVDDVLAGLEALGRAGRARTKARVVAVTGSVGKTSTKEMLRDVLSAQGRTHAAEASYNNHWGVPLTLARMPVETEFAVIEIGMNHPSEIAPLARMARPHVAMITTVAAAHLEAFENIEGIAHEKAAIFDGLEPGGVAVINADLETTPILLAAARAQGVEILTFGKAGEAARLFEATLSDDKTVVQAEVNGVVPYADARVRRALAMAVDNSVCLQIGYSDQGTVAENHHVCPIHPEYAELPPPVFDPAGAMALMQEAGMADYVHELISIDDDWRRNTSDSVAAQLRDAGFQVERNILPGSTFWNDWAKYPFSATDWAQRPLGVQVLALAYRSGEAWNETGFANAAFDAALEKALSIADADTRRETMAELQKIMQDEGVVIQPYWRSTYRHHKENVLGAEMHPTFEIHVYKLGLAA